jgi:hypothetical protein
VQEEGNPSPDEGAALGKSSLIIRVMIRKTPPLTYMT